MFFTRNPEVFHGFPGKLLANGGLSEKPWANLAKPSKAVVQPTCYAAKLVNRGRLNGECFMDISAVGWVYIYIS